MLKLQRTLENRNNQTIVSLRSNDVIVNDIAQRNGGGGHDFAASFHILNNLLKKLSIFIDNEIKKGTLTNIPNN